MEPIDLHETLRTLVIALREQLQIPGLSVAVAAPGFSLWSEGFGQADIENEVPATADTVYRLASISKPITATAVMQLAEQGKLDLDAPIQHYVPSFPEKPWPITVRLLLAHLSGIRDFTGDEGSRCVHHAYGSVPLESFLAGFADDPLLHEPCTKFRYSTPGYNLLGCAIEAASGRDYLGYVRENIFALAGMTTARADDARTIIPHRARGYARNAGEICNAAFTDLSDHLPGGGFCATAADVVRFGVALHAGRLLSPETLSQVFTRQRTSSGQDTRFGLGWFLWSRHGEIEAAHGGKHHGASTMLYLLPESGITVAVLTNLQAVPSPVLHRLTQSIADRVYEFVRSEAS